ncbi:MAG: GNAT family N-acetyltransferase [Bacteroides sp.]|nr:GNAT family N-acetyltransferase [Bacteroides sp.]MCM1550491.1 GNAT family N-acetyltransferase [Clostridium sp.]
MKEVELKYNALDVDTYLSLRSQVQWKPLLREQAKAALKSSLFIVTAYLEDTCVGMGRLVGDGAVICYVQDLIVLPKAQGRGIGSKVLTALKEKAEELRMENTEMMLCLMCAKGRELFYESHGFLARPTDQLGPGMIQYLRETD